MSASNIDSLAGIGLVSAASLALLGLPIQPIMWGFIGGILGAGFAPPVKVWLVSAMTYTGASLTSALVGVFVSAHYFGADATSSNAITAGMAVFFHPILMTAVKHVPALVDRIANAFSRERPS